LAGLDTSDEDARFMAAALSFSRRGLGLAAPNPSVGALVVRSGVIVGRGVTQKGGRPHAETQALAEAGGLAQGATLYVTLEPCSHHGKTPPCTEAILAAGIRRVVSALEDANPKVAGRGHAQLRAAGVEVVVGIGAEEARRLHLGHSLVVTEGRPMVTLKLAQTADGFAAGLPGTERLLITGSAANDFTHYQRAKHDAIMIGADTALADDPSLTVRLQGLEDRKSLRIVLDEKAALPLSSQLVQTAREVPTLLLTSEAAPASMLDALCGQGVDVVRVQVNDEGKLNLHTALRSLADKGLTRIFCEGGPRLGASLIALGFVDDVMLLQSRKTIGAGLPALSPEARAKLAEPQHYRLAETRDLGEDTLTRYERKL